MDNRHYEKFADGRAKDIEDELPFAVPKGWTWCRLREIGQYKKGPFGSSLTKSIFVPKSDNTVKVYEQKNVIQKRHTLGEYYITREYFESNMKNFEVFPGDILVSCAGTIGETYILPDGIEQGIINQALMRMSITRHIDKLYFLKYFDHSLKEIAVASGKGIAIKNIPSFDIFKNFLFPLPPLTEQQRIVNIIEAIFAQIDLLEQNRTDLQTAIKQAKSKILDLAIHGKLVPQDPNDEPASVMLEKLRAEKEAKIVSGKMKRDKHDSYIYKNTADNCYYQKYSDGYEENISDEIPFDVPAGWAWCRLAEIYYHTTGKALKKSNEKGSLKKYITTSNLYWDTFDLSEVRTMYFTDDELDKYTIKKGDLVLCNGGDVGRAAIWSYDKDICYQNHISRMRPKTNGIENRFFLYVLKFYKEQNMLKGKGIGISSLSASDLLSVIIPLPSLFEQQRIVAKIEELFAKLDLITV